MAKYAAFGTQLKRNGATIAQLKTIGGPGLALDTEDVTSHDSPGGWEEVVGTILRSGEVSLDLVFDPADATHKNTSGGLIGDMISRTPHQYQLVLPTSPATTWTFDALVTKFEPSADASGALTASATLKVTGEPTL